jgi:hypothetical protein
VEPRSPHDAREAGHAPPILYWFRATTTPTGGAPETVRRQWVGVPLPVRDPRPVEGPLPYVATDVVDPAIRRAINDGVAVAPEDALDMLHRFDRHNAADWWENLLKVRTNIKSFVFRRTEGELLPPTLARMLYPELDAIDDAG